MIAVGLTIKWLGHACFLITTAAGSNIVIDPFGAGVGYKPPSVKADVVFVSHAHFDHNAVDALESSRNVVRPLEGKDFERGAVTSGKCISTQRAIVCRKENIPYKSILTYHDPSGGKERGENTVRLIVVDGIRICHLGDLGHVLTADQVKAIGPVDVLLIPVGGVYTIDGAQAQKVVRQIKPKLVVPMHYKTPALKINLEPPDKFLSGFKNVKHAEKLVVSKDSLPKETTVVVLKY
jgi:L-ascorbate metabolism protein UlaG (beta-lactamase superfamily)